MAAPQRPRNPFQRWLADGRWHVPALVGVPALVVVAILALVLFNGGGDDDLGAVDIKSAVPLDPSDLDAVAAAGFPGPPPEEEGVALVRSIEELHEIFGEPPFADVGRMRIPALGVDAPISLRIVGEDGAMPNPVGPDEVTLYDFGPWEGYGARPGEGGNAVFSGHVDQRRWLEYAQVNYEGLAIFYHLDNLTPGQVIEVDVYGGTHSYTVQWVRELSAADGDWGEVLGPDPSGAETITLITCGGTFNAVDGSYASRVVVRAVAG